MLHRGEVITPADRSDALRICQPIVNVPNAGPFDARKVLQELMFELESQRARLSRVPVRV